MRVVSFLFFIFFLLTGCNFHHSEEAEYCRMAYRIMDQFVRDMHKKNYLMCCSKGGGFLKKVNEIHLSFETFGPLSQDELRILMVTVVEEFLNRINKDEEIRPYLVNYPFTDSNLNFIIALVDTRLNPIRNKGAGKDLLYGVFLIDGKLIYDISNEEKKMLQAVHRESYKEAYEIVKQRPYHASESHDKSLEIICNQILERESNR